MGVSSQLRSQVLQNLTVTDRLSVGQGSLRNTAFPVKLEMLQKNVLLTQRSNSRQRFSSLYKEAGKTWKVPTGYIVQGLTVSASDQQSLEVLKALPTSLSSAEADVPCGEIALTVHRTTDESTTDACTPAGNYVLAGSSAYNTESNFTTGTDYVDAPNAFGEYFQYFLVNSGTLPDSEVISQDANWDQVAYRQAVSGTQYLGQSGAPVVYMDASRSVFGSISSDVQKQCNVYIPFTTGCGLVADGSWGIAIGFVAEAGYPSGAAGLVSGTNQWPSLSLDVIVHCQAVGAD